MKDQPLTFVRMRAVMAKTAQCRTAIYRQVRAGTFPRPFAIGPRAVAWPAHEIDAVNAARLAGKSDEEIQALVSRMYAARQNGGAHA